MSNFVTEYFKSLFSEISTSFLIGFIIGYFLKKSIKLLFFMIIIFSVILFVKYEAMINSNNMLYLPNNIEKIFLLFKSTVAFFKNHLSFFWKEDLSGLIAGLFFGFKLG